LNQSKSDAARSLREHAETQDVPAGEGRQLARRTRFLRAALVLALLVTLTVVIFFYPFLFVTIHAGERGVLWSRWTGTELDTIYLEGTQFVLPWNKIVIYDVRYKVANQTLMLLSSDGLPITVDMMVRYRPADRLLARLHEQIGPDYVNVVVLPEVATALREVVAKCTVEDLYESRFSEVRDAMLTEARKETGKRYVVLDDVMFKNIRLPEPVSQAIQHKIQQQQQFEEMKYVLNMEEAEAERKVIESKGIEEQQRHIDNTLTDRLLEYKSIEATKSLAQSPNSKIVVIGNGMRGGPPIILSPGDQPAQQQKR
jgi:regulator of protease activity HflC (stomatin/prohibitin superfamily)